MISNGIKSKLRLITSILLCEQFISFLPYLTLSPRTHVTRHLFDLIGGDNNSPAIFFFLFSFPSIYFLVMVFAIVEAVTN